MRRYLAVLALVAVSDASAFDFNRMAEGVSEDAAKYLEVGRRCALPNSPKAAALLALLADAAPEATLRGARRGTVLIEGAFSMFGRVEACAAARQGRAKLTADIESTHDDLDRFSRAVNAPPTKGTGRATLSGASNGADYMAASRDERVRWVETAMAATGRATPRGQTRTRDLVVKCLTDMMTVEKPEEAASVARFREASLPSLTASCLLPLTR